ncbi:MAG: hypothetical protein AAF849_03520 [Bacteroidota bacterium]
MHYSNSKIRLHAIWKALLLSILPMIFTGLAVYLIVGRSSEVEGVNCRTMQAEKVQFNRSLKTVEKDWKALLTTYQHLLNNESGNARSALLKNIEDAEINLLNNLSLMKETLADTAFIARMATMNRNFEQYFEQMEKYSTQNQRTLPSSDPNCELIVSGLEREIDELRRDLGREHRAELERLLPTTNIIRRNQRALLEMISFGRDN